MNSNPALRKTNNNNDLDDVSERPDSKQTVRDPLRIREADQSQKKLAETDSSALIVTAKEMEDWKDNQDKSDTAEDEHGAQHDGLHSTLPDNSKALDHDESTSTVITLKSIRSNSQKENSPAKVQEQSAVAPNQNLSSDRESSIPMISRVLEAENRESTGKSNIPDKNPQSKYDEKQKLQAYRLILNGYQMRKTMNLNRRCMKKKRFPADRPAAFNVSQRDESPDSHPQKGTGNGLNNATQDQGQDAKSSEGGISRDKTLRGLQTPSTPGLLNQSTPIRSVQLQNRRHSTTAGTSGQQHLNIIGCSPDKKSSQSYQHGRDQPESAKVCMSPGLSPKLKHKKVPKYIRATPKFMSVNKESHATSLTELQAQNVSINKDSLSYDNQEPYTINKINMNGSEGFGEIYADQGPHISLVQVQMPKGNAKTGHHLKKQNVETIKDLHEYSRSDSHNLNNDPGRKYIEIKNKNRNEAIQNVIFNETELCLNEIDRQLLLGDKVRTGDSSYVSVTDLHKSKIVGTEEVFERSAEDHVRHFWNWHVQQQEMEAVIGNGLGAQLQNNLITQTGSWDQNTEQHPTSKQQAPGQRPHLQPLQQIRQLQQYTNIMQEQQSSAIESTALHNPTVYILSQQHQKESLSIKKAPQSHNQNIKNRNFNAEISENKQKLNKISASNVYSGKIETIKNDRQNVHSSSLPSRPYLSSALNASQKHFTRTNTQMKFQREQDLSAWDQVQQMVETSASNKTFFASQNPKSASQKSRISISQKQELKANKSFVIKPSVYPMPQQNVSSLTFSKGFRKSRSYVSSGPTTGSHMSQQLNPKKNRISTFMGQRRSQNVRYKQNEQPYNENGQIKESKQNRNLKKDDTSQKFGEYSIGSSLKLNGNIDIQLNRPNRQLKASKSLIGVQLSYNHQRKPSTASGNSLHEYYKLNHIIQQSQNSRGFLQNSSQKRIRESSLAQHSPTANSNRDFPRNFTKSEVSFECAENKEKIIENLKAYHDDHLDEEVDRVLKKVQHKKAMQTYQRFFKNQSKPGQPEKVNFETGSDPENTFIEQQEKIELLQKRLSKKNEIKILNRQRPYETSLQRYSKIKEKHQDRNEMSVKTIPIKLHQHIMTNSTGLNPVFRSFDRRDRLKDNGWAHQSPNGAENEHDVMAYNDQRQIKPNQEKIDVSSTLQDSGVKQNLALAALNRTARKGPSRMVPTLTSSQMNSQVSSGSKSQANLFIQPRIFMGNQPNQEDSAVEQLLATDASREQLFDTQKELEPQIQLQGKEITQLWPNGQDGQNELVLRNAFSRKMSTSVAKETNYINSALKNMYDPLRIENLMGLFPAHKVPHQPQQACQIRSSSLNEHKGSIYGANLQKDSSSKQNGEDFSFVDGNQNRKSENTVTFLDQNFGTGRTQKTKINETRSFHTMQKSNSRTESPFQSFNENIKIVNQNSVSSPYCPEYYNPLACGNQLKTEILSNKNSTLQSPLIPEQAASPFINEILKQTALEPWQVKGQVNQSQSAMQQQQMNQQEVHILLNNQLIIKKKQRNQSRKNNQSKSTDGPTSAQRRMEPTPKLNSKKTKHNAVEKAITYKQVNIAESANRVMNQLMPKHSWTLINKTVLRKVQVRDKSKMTRGNSSCVSDDNETKLCYQEKNRLHCKDQKYDISDIIKNAVSLGPVVDAHAGSPGAATTPGLESFPSQASPELKIRMNPLKQGQYNGTIMEDFADF